MRKITRGIIHRSSFVSTVQVGVIFLLGIIPCPLTAADPGVPSAVPPLHSTDKAIGRDYAATITISIGPKDKPKKVLCSHTLSVPSGRENFGIECARSYRIEVLIETAPEKDPVEHSAQIVIVGLGRKIPRNFVVPRMTFADGQSCLVKTFVDNGDELEVKLSVSQSKPAK